MFQTCFLCWFCSVWFCFRRNKYGHSEVGFSTTQGLAEATSDHFQNGLLLLREQIDGHRQEEKRRPSTTFFFISFDFFL